MHFEQLGGSMKTEKSRRSFTPEFRLEAAQLVVEQNYTVREAAQAMGVGKSTMDKWVRQLRQELSGITPKAMPMTPDQRKIRELEAKIRRIETEKEILKKATVDSINHCNTKVKSLCTGGFIDEAHIYPERERVYFRQVEVRHWI